LKDEEFSLHKLLLCSLWRDLKKRPKCVLAI